MYVYILMIVDYNGVTTYKVVSYTHDVQLKGQHSSVSLYIYTHVSTRDQWVIQTGITKYSV